MSVRPLAKIRNTLDDFRPSPSYHLHHLALCRINGTRPSPLPPSSRPRKAPGVGQRRCRYKDIPCERCGHDCDDGIC
ncbi:hypothetical protein GWI33_017666 [Rhynchophorus ferrugineus]|uniref:Uncharacterized protein n=1 Tax=Rhynchophorus ferrugineus TaxID=354439 RepID=A0A834HZA0_RHYFE|nr:hypothetical protein GWI33_017666 [Rhynchophorus ferrugineus]